MKVQKRLIALLVALPVFFSCQKEPEALHIPVEYIILNPAEVSLAVGDEQFLSSTVGPVSADNRSIEWDSSDNSVATVDNGMVKAVGAGNATITASATDGSGVSGTCKVTVRLFPSALTLSPGQQRDLGFGPDGGSVTVSFKASEPWTASAINTRADSWLSISPESGEPGEAQLTVTAAASDELDERRATLQISAGQDTEFLSVTQKQKDALTVTSSFFEVDSSGGTVTIEVKSNVDFTCTVEPGCSWIKYVETKEYGSHTVLLSVLANTGVNSREASVGIAGSGLTEKVKVFQFGSEPSIVLADNEFEIGPEGGDITVEVKSNVDVTMEIPSGIDWISEGDTQSTNVFHLSVAPNPEPDGRMASITFSGGGLQETVTVVQRQKDVLELLDADILVPEAGAYFEVELQSNVEFVVSLDHDWIREVSTRALVTGKRGFVAEALPLTAALRTAVIVFTTSDRSIERSFSVAQAEESPQIEFQDPVAEQICLQNWDFNSDGRFTQREAAAVTDLNIAFYKNSQLVSFDELRFFTGLSSIPGFAFAYCSSLSSITLPGQIQSIGDNAFAGCSSLEGIEIPAGVTSVGSKSFAYCSSLMYIEFLSAEPAYIDGDAFQGFNGWIFVPEGRVQAYSDMAGWSSYSDCIHTREEVESSPVIVFEDEAVKEICIAHWDRDRDGDFSELEASLVTRLDHLFSSDAIVSFDELRFFTSVEALESWEFGDCHFLEHMVLPPNLSIIGDYCFAMCQSLKELKIPSSVVSIGTTIIAGCEALYSIELLSPQPPQVSEEAFDLIYVSWIFVPEGSVRTYRDDESWNAYSSRIHTRREVEDSPEIVFADPEVKTICTRNWDVDGDGELSELEASIVDLLRRQFRQNELVSSFDELRFFTGLTRLENNSFYGCKALRSIILPDHIEELPNSAFNGCESLQAVHLPSSLQTIGNSVFSRCSSLETLELPESLRSIGSNAFSYCSGLRKITVPQHVESIGSLAFREDSALEDIEFTSPVPPVASTNFMYETGSCYIYVPLPSVMDYKYADVWRGQSSRITSRGHEPSEFYYRSTDFSRDGEVVRLQAASVGKGVDLIFVGDGFTDTELLPGGVFESKARAFMEQFFIYEPYKSLRNRFNVWCVKVVSENCEYGTKLSRRALTEDLSSSDLRANSTLIYDYAGRVPVWGDNPRKIVVIANVYDSFARSWCLISKNCYCLVLEPLEMRPSVVNHEMGGHGIGFLADEYEEFSGSYPDAGKLDQWYEKSGWYGNVDWRSDPATVRWAHLLADPRYAHEGLGVFEGAFQYPKGIFRSTEEGMMRSDYAKGAVFNAPGRELIYKQVMQYSEGPGWTFDYETFVKFDEAGRKQAADAYAGIDILNSPRRAPSMIERYEPGIPPIIADESVRAVTVSKEGRVILSY